MKAKLLAAVIALSPVSALAAPVSLDCYLDTKSGQQKWSISLNEDQGSLTYSHELATGTTKAMFTPDAVIWGEGDMSIDRVTLAFARKNTFGGRLSGIDRGKCVVSQRKRAF